MVVSAPFSMDVGDEIQVDGLALAFASIHYAWLAGRYLQTLPFLPARSYIGKNLAPKTSAVSGLVFSVTGIAVGPGRSFVVKMLQFYRVASR